LNALEQERDKLQREVAIVGGELEDASAEREKRGTVIAKLEDELEAVRRRHAADLETEQMRFSAVEAKVAKLDAEHNELEANLHDLRRSALASAQDLEHEKHSSEMLRQELEELRKAKAASDKRGHQTQVELDAIKRKMDTELAGGNARFDALQAKYSRLEKDAAKQENLITELKTRNAHLQTALDSEKSQVLALQEEVAHQATLLRKAENAARLLEEELQGLRDQLAECRHDYDQVRLRLAKLEEQLAETQQKSLDLAETFRMRKIRSGICLMQLIFERLAAMHYTCAFYYWGQVASDGAMHRGATELANIIEEAESKESKGNDIKKFDDDWDIQAIDIQAMGKEFGL